MTALTWQQGEVGWPHAQLKIGVAITMEKGGHQHYAALMYLSFYYRLGTAFYLLCLNNSAI